MVDFERKEPRFYVDPHTGLFRDRQAEQERYDRWLRKVGEWAVILMILGWLALAVVFG